MRNPKAPHVISQSTCSFAVALINHSDVVALDRINRALSRCEDIDLAILRKSCAGSSRRGIAFEQYIGETTLRYRLEKICRAAECKDNAELFALLRQFDIHIKE